MTIEELGNECMSVMNKNFRYSGIDFIGDVPWGTHFCQFYKTREDLIDILVPYFKAGLENNEFCMWVTSQPLGVQEVKEALQRVIPDIDVYLEKGQLEIIPYTHWYVKEGVFDSDRVLNGWVEKLNQALTNGYDGLRLTGNTFWLEKEDLNDFVDYEEEVDRVLSNYQMIALCTCSLDRCNATEIIDVVVNHQFALIKKNGKWEQIESSKRKEAEETAILQSLQSKRAEIERKRAEQELEMTVEFLHLMNKSKGTVELVQSAVNFFRERSGFEAVGIRLKDGNDYPYFETSGFPEEFVRLENSLCVRKDAGQPIYDSAGYPIQECMCSNVICGRFDPSKPFFTTRGSFYTNCTTVLATTTDADRQARTRNRCNGEGYESVALIALCVGEERLGLLQLNDRRKGQFSQEKISMWERLTDYLAVALAKAQAEESLQKAHENLQMQSEELQVQFE